MDKSTVVEKPQIDWPVVEVDDIKIPVEFSFLTFYRASKAGIDLRDLTSVAGCVSAQIDLFTIIARPTLEKLELPAMTPEDWTEKIGQLPDPMAKFQEIARATGTAYKLSKLRPAAPPAPQAAAKEAGQTTQVQ